MSNTYKSRTVFGQPGGAAVKFMSSSSTAWGSSAQIPADLQTAYQAMLWQASHIQNRGGWAQILAQGQSSSKKTWNNIMHSNIYVTVTHFNIHQHMTNPSFIYTPIPPPPPLY